MPNNEFDYTAKSIGSRQPPYGRKIIVCEKCGRRGTDDGVLRGATSSCRKVTHRGRIDTGCGIAIFHVVEHCSYPAPHQRKAEGG